MLSHSVPSPRSQMKADCRPPVPTQANHDPASPPAVPPRSRLYKLIAGCFVPFAAPTILGLLMVIFLVIPARMQPELRLIPGSSLSSLNISISISHCELVTIEYARMKLLLSSDGRLTLSRPSLESTFSQAHGWVTSLGAKALTTLLIVADLGVNCREEKIDVAAKAKRSLCLGPWWVAVLDVDISFTGLTFTAPSDGGGSGNQMILQGILSCSIDIIPQLWQEKSGVLV